MTPRASILVAATAAILAVSPARAEQAGAFEVVPFGPGAPASAAGGPAAPAPAAPAPAAAPAAAPAGEGSGEELGEEPTPGVRSGLLDHDPFTALDLGDPERPAEERAADFTAAGLEALSTHDHEAAARLLEAAYRLGGDPEVLYPLAQALSRAGEPAAAADRLERYMAEASLDARQRVAVGRELEALRRQFSRVTIETTPQGALLLLGGEPLGTTPLGRALTLMHGEYLVEARLEGYRDASRQFAVPGGPPVDLLLSLEPLAGPGRGGTTALDVALWTSVALAGAFAVAAVATGGATAAAYADLGEDPSSGALPGVQDLLYATFGLSGATAALALTATGLAIARAVGGHRDQDAR